MKTSTKTAVKCVLFALLYILIVYASLCLGYLHPFFWAYAATVSALFAAIPYLYLASKGHAGLDAGRDACCDGPFGHCRRACDRKGDEKDFLCVSLTAKEAPRKTAGC